MQNTKKNASFHRKKKRFWMRSLILILLSVLILIAVWQAFQSRENGSLIQAGDQAVNFELPSISGSSIMLGDYEGKAVVLNFWATYCEPCEKELPYFEELASAYKDEVVFLTVNEDNSKVSVEQFLHSRSIDLPVLLDNGQVMDAYGVEPLPSTFFISAEGTVNKTVIGPLDLGQLQENIEDLLAAG